MGNGLGCDDVVGLVVSHHPIASRWVDLIRCGRWKFVVVEIKLQRRNIERW